MGGGACVVSFLLACFLSFFHFFLFSRLFLVLVCWTDNSVGFEGAKALLRQYCHSNGLDDVVARLEGEEGYEIQVVEESEEGEKIEEEDEGYEDDSNDGSYEYDDEDWRYMATALTLSGWLEVG